MKKRNLFFVISILVLMASCAYEDGPLISFRSAKNRISKHWRFNIVTRSGFEITHQFKDQSIEFTKGGDATYYFVDSTLTGIWNLREDRTILMVKLNLSNGSQVIINYTITRLKEGELEMYETYSYVEMKYYMKPLEE